MKWELIGAEGGRTSGIEVSAVLSMRVRTAGVGCRDRAGVEL